MSDRELLELAAKAAGMYVLPADKPWPRDADAGWFFCEHGPRGAGMNGLKQHGFWNPRTDDGDSRRLQVKLLLTVAVRPHECEVFDDDGECLSSVSIHEGVDPEDATRYAVLQAAAAIGKAMP